MSMKRTVPGGRVESIYTQSKNGKEVIATTVVSVETESDETVEVIEQIEETPAIDAEETESKSNE